MHKYPKYDVIYTYAEMTKLHLSDSPHLGIRFPNGATGVIQNAHCTEEQMLAIPGMSESRWRYDFTTIESIPIFNCVDDPEKIAELVDVEPNFDHFTETFSETDLWVTPKGIRWEQYGLRDAIKKGFRSDVTAWLDPDWASKHCVRCERYLTPRDSELTDSNREQLNFDGVCAMCKAHEGNQEAIDLQADSIYSNNKFSKRYTGHS